MIFQRTLKAVAALAAVAAAVAASVAAAAFALYALLQPLLGRPGAAAMVALVFALIAALVALLMSRGMGGARRRRGEPADQGLGERLFDLARSKPLLSAGAAIAAGLIALRNPALVGLIMTAVLKKPDNPR